MIFTSCGSLVTHQYCYLEPNSIGEHDWISVAWFGLVSFPGRMWGCHVMLECGAIYRNVPLHHLAIRPGALSWHPSQAQTWDCYGHSFSLHEYTFLKARRMICRLKDNSEPWGSYLFTIAPMLDSWSEHADQSKEFMVVALDNGRYTAQPTDRILVEDRSFTNQDGWPMFLRRQTQVWSCET